jgi:hypothetical protein
LTLLVRKLNRFEYRYCDLFLIRDFNTEIYGRSYF